MDLFFSYYQLILIPLWPVLWDYKVPIFEVPIMGTFTNSDGLKVRFDLSNRKIAGAGQKLPNNWEQALTGMDVLEL